MAQLQIILSERMKMMFMRIAISDEDGDDDIEGDSDDDVDGEGNDEIEKVWSCMLCVLGRPLS